MVLINTFFCTKLFLDKIAIYTLCRNTHFSTSTIHSCKNSQDMPNFEMENPYKRKISQCILCKYKIVVDYKNPRLLTQFLSPFTGLLYDRHITGLCETQHQALKKEIKKARYLGLLHKCQIDPKFKNDPRLFNPLKPQRPHPF